MYASGDGGREESGTEWRREVFGMLAEIGKSPLARKLSCSVDFLFVPYMGHGISPTSVSKP